MSSQQPPTRLYVIVEAADWYARLRAGNVSEMDAARFRAWLARDPVHREEFEALDALWDDLGALADSPQVERERAAIAAQRSSALGLEPEAPAATASSEKGGPRPLIRSRNRISLAIAAAVLAALALWWSRSEYSEHYSTGVGEQRVIPLADGTVVTLNTATALQVKYTDAERRVQLMRGQANFNVAKDPERPFIVAAGAGEVRAIGTIFDVYKATDQVTVTLIEGKVAVLPAARAPERAYPVALEFPLLISVPYPDAKQIGAPLSWNMFADASSSMYAQRIEPHVTAAASLEAGTVSASPPQPQGQPPQAGTALEDEFILTAGEQISYSPDAVVLKRIEVDIPRVSAWRKRKLDFAATPLAEAIAEANRYSRLQIELAVPELQDSRISGTFEAGRNDLFVEGLQAYFDLDVEFAGDDRIVLTAAQ